MRDPLTVGPLSFITFQSRGGGNRCIVIQEFLTTPQLPTPTFYRLMKLQTSSRLGFNGLIICKINVCKICMCQIHESSYIWGTGQKRRSRRHPNERNVYIMIYFFITQEISVTKCYNLTKLGEGNECIRLQGRRKKGDRGESELFGRK